MFAKAPRRDIAWLTSRPIAHRGLHDPAQQRPENSMAAFSAALAAGYAIECDVHLSRDGVPVVFHDDILDRLTPESGPLADRTAADLSQITIAGTSQTIPTLDDLLSLVSGRVPLLIELKEGPAGAALARKAASRLRAYDGPAALMSFDAEILREIRASEPDIPCGLTAEGTLRAGFRHLATIAKLGLDFVSYSVDDLPTPGPVLARRMYGTVLLCWTVRYPEQMEKAKRWADQITFEGFRP